MSTSKQNINGHLFSKAITPFSIVDDCSAIVARSLQQSAGDSQALAEEIARIDQAIGENVADRLMSDLGIPRFDDEPTERTPRESW